MNYRMKIIDTGLTFTQPNDLSRLLK